jgi:hypothetical protein
VAVKVLVICPSRGRPNAAKAVLESFLTTRADETTRLVFLVDDTDANKADYPEGWTRIVRSRGSFGGALAQGGPVLEDATAIGVIGDDNRFRTKGWDTTLGAWLTQNVGIAYGTDGHWDEALPTAWWLSRPIVDRLGVAPQFVRHYFMDNYWLELGKAAGAIRYFPDVLVEHLHPLWGKAAEDATYARNARNVARDRVAWRRWLAGGMAPDLGVLRAARNTRQRPVVFADWHHPALWESLRLLFEVRLGWDLYSPAGLEWESKGWRFTHEDWKAADYLSTEGAEDMGTHLEVAPAEYPDTRRRLLTVDQANAMAPTHVLASVAAHRASFATLAANWGAQFVYQVGNARQPVDVARGTAVLASARLIRPPRHIRVVEYHQEFDLDVFGYSKPTHPKRVTSFMLRMDAASGPWQWLEGDEELEWRAIGGKDERAESYVAPMSAVAAMMRDTGWVWHDKIIGDGYGHVLHNAAAMGRPLIGHASHYAGRLGEPYWRDLVTCIDLDRHSPEVALRLIKAIGKDRDWFTSMGQAIHEEFTRRVDFAAEAMAIRALLA